MSKPDSGGRSSAIRDYASQLRFPYLLLLTAAAFAVDLAVPDLVPFIDEIVLGLAMTVLATWRERKSVAATTDEPQKNAAPSADR